MNNHQQFQQNMQMGSGLTRYRSAPSSYFASLLSSPGSDGGFGADDFAQLFNPRASSPETQIIFSRFMNGTDVIQQTCPSNLTLPSQNPALLPPRKSDIEDYQSPQRNPALLPPRKSEIVEYQPPPQKQRKDYSYANHNSEAAPDSAAVDRVFASFNSNCAAAQPKMELPAAATSSLIRHSSSPAGLFANINIENELKTTGSIGSYGGCNRIDAEASFSSASRLMGRMDYSSRHSSSGMMEPIAEIGSKGKGENAAEDAQFDEEHGSDVDYITGLPVNSWDDSPLISDHYLKGVADNESKRFFIANASDDQKNEASNRPKTLLSHHLSLPKSSADLSAMEKLLQDSVPCKIRAKRGCATHPRSIAERVRRTKISERMRKLQELVPNMEKQTNTSDMLDLAVDYIKELQRQVKTLSDNQANCSCSMKQRS